MAKHRPGEGMTPVAEFIDLPEGATEGYADDLHEINAESIVNEEARA